MSCGVQRIKYHNRPNLPSEHQVLGRELKKIFDVDTCLDFRFEITFLSHGTPWINNFECKVYPNGGDDNAELLGILQRGGVDGMKLIKLEYNGC